MSLGFLAKYICVGGDIKGICIRGNIERIPDWVLKQADDHNSKNGLVRVTLRCFQVALIVTQMLIGYESEGRHLTMTVGQRQIIARTEIVREYAEPITPIEMVNLHY